MLFSGILGFALAVAVGIGRVSRNWYRQRLCYAFTSVIRGTPLLVQIFILYYGLGSLFASIAVRSARRFWLDGPICGTASGMWCWR